MLSSRGEGVTVGKFVALAVIETRSTAVCSFLINIVGNTCNVLIVQYYFKITMKSMMCMLAIISLVILLHFLVFDL